MEEKKWNEVIAFGYFAISLLVLLSLLSYTPNDVAFEVSSPNSPVQNFVGPFGAYTGWILRTLFGATAYFLVPLFLFWSLAKWSGKKGQSLWLRVFSVTIFLSSACSLFSLTALADPVSRFQAGGMIGYFCSLFLTSVFGRAGLLVALSLFLMSVILATEMLLLQIAGSLFEKVKERLMFGERSAEPRHKPKSLPVKWVEFKQALTKKVSPQPKLTARSQEYGAADNGSTGLENRPKIKLSIPKPEVKKEPRPLVAAGSARASAGASAAASAAGSRTVIDCEILENGSYRLPSIDLLLDAKPLDQDKIQEDLQGSSRILENTLEDFGIDAKVVEVEQGPTITRYELQPAAGVKVQRITSLENDIALAMSATSVRIVAPIPGKSRVGIEVPNRAAAVVSLKEVLLTQEFQNEKSPVTIVIGRDTAGVPLVCNLADMPHLMIAGATNTGKSVCINSILMSLLYRSTPEQVKFLLIDPKMVELHFFNELPHLICPVVTDKAKAPAALAWLLSEMERRYKVLSRVGAKNIFSFNEKVEKKSITSASLKPSPEGELEQEPILVRKMPYIVLVIDELADLMLASAHEVETSITRLAQLARAVGIHMILATQRPSVDVITGVIKANFPARIAFQVASKVDSRTILDENGADKLLGRGDLLLMDPRKSKVVRAQGAWVQDSEIEKVTQFIRMQNIPAHHEAVLSSSEKKQSFGEFRKDEVYEEAKRMVLETGQASVSMVQRKLGVGYTRAARLIDMMEEEGVLGPYRGAKPREILVERPGADSAGQEDSMTSIGAILKEARIKKDISYEDVHAKIKIHPRVLQLLEEEKFEKLPSPLFVKSFLKSYADFLEINAEGLVDSYEKEKMKEPEQVLFLKPADSSAGQKTHPLMMAGGALLAALLLFVFMGDPARMLKSWTSKKPKSLQTVKLHPEPPKDPSGALKQRQAKDKGEWLNKVEFGNFPKINNKTPLFLQLKALDNVWVHITADKKIIFQGIVKKGVSEQWSAKQSIEIWTGNASNMTLTLNKIPLGSPGKGVVKRMILSHEGIRIAAPVDL